MAQIGFEETANALVTDAKRSVTHSTGESDKKMYQISDYRIVLVAPTSYFSGDFNGFDARINYGDIFEWFASNISMGNRKQYKLSLLHSAIEKSTFG